MPAVRSELANFGAYCRTSETSRSPQGNEAGVPKSRDAARPWVNEIREACLTASRQALPQSALGKAADYTLNMWAKLERCFEYEQVELSNNLAENSMHRWRWDARTGCTGAV